ncbi:hypothetical protein DFH11DRAFT_1292944 [Phellopilus nigrolimitatus]|nr:hypothetical protein DFH11DRAFT_1292944 [Phellopilus nigrolimitatus]
MSKSKGEETVKPYPHTGSPLKNSLSVRTDLSENTDKRTQTGATLEKTGTKEVHANSATRSPDKKKDNNSKTTTTGKSGNTAGNHAENDGHHGFLSTAKGFYGKLAGTDDNKKDKHDPKGKAKENVNGGGVAENTNGKKKHEDPPKEHREINKSRPERAENPEAKKKHNPRGLEADALKSNDKRKHAKPDIFNASVMAGKEEGLKGTHGPSESAKPIPPRSLDDSSNRGNIVDQTKNNKHIRTPESTPNTTQGLPSQRTVKGDRLSPSEIKKKRVAELVGQTGHDVGNKGTSASARSLSISRTGDLNGAGTKVAAYNDANPGSSVQTKDDTRPSTLRKGVESLGNSSDVRASEKRAKDDRHDECEHLECKCLACHKIIRKGACAGYDLNRRVPPTHSSEPVHGRAEPLSASRTREAVNYEQDYKSHHRGADKDVCHECNQRLPRCHTCDQVLPLKRPV